LLKALFLNYKNDLKKLKKNSIELWMWWKFHFVCDTKLVKKGFGSLLCLIHLGVGSKFLQAHYGTFWSYIIWEYNKVFQPTFSSNVEDERYFNTLSFMKNKIWKRLTTHLEFCVWFYSQDFFSFHIFPYECVFKVWKEVKMWYLIDC
jgi:hypothetical protein